jgi:hypothetical protein
MFQKKAVGPYPKESPEYKYRELVTPYVWSFIFKQLMQKSAITIEEHEGDNRESLCQTAQGKVAVNMNSCTCSFYKSMVLPCRYLLKSREIKGEDLFSNDLIGIRWKLSYVKSSHRLFEDESEASPSPVCSIVKTTNRVRNMSQSSKFRELHMITRELASVASEATGDEYEQKRDILRNLVQLWSKNKTCMVIEVLGTDQVDDSTSTLENICRNEKLVSEHSERKQ